MHRRDALRIALGSAGALALGARPAHTFAAAAARAGHAYPHAEPALRAAADHLAAARAAGEWLLRHARPTDAGTAWPVAPDAGDDVQVNLYSGNAGVVLFLLALHDATGEARYLDAATAGARELAAGHIARDLTRGNAGLYSGAAGLAFTLGAAHRATGVAEFGEAAHAATAQIGRGARRQEQGVDWGDVTDIVSGTAGTGLFLLHVARAYGMPAALETAAAAGRRLVALGQPAHGGLMWAMSPAVPRNYPNFSHGTAGVAYFLAELYRATGEQPFLDAARAGAAYLDAIATKRDGGALVFHSEPGNEDLYYLSWCHGPAGTGRLYHALARASGDEAWTACLHAAARGVLGTGIPERRTPGYWNNISQCCGDAGVGEFFLALHRRDPREEYIGMARRTAAYLHEHATADGEGGLKWIQAEHRVRPTETVAQTGLMQGAAGVGLFLLRLHAHERGREEGRGAALPDTPFG